MRRWVMGSVIAILCMLAIPTICLGQAAAGEEWQAERLKQLGLFLGTDQGFELERESSRVEAVVMLIRLLGKEEEALSGGGPAADAGPGEGQEPALAHPFTDVPAWAERYVAYAYQHRLAMGVTGDKFGSGDAVTAAQYYTFVLRALGYQDGDAGDFRWDRAADQARAVGIAGAELYADGSKALARGDLASISYHALEASMKGEAATLLDKLVADGAVTQEQAASLKAAQAAESAAGDEPAEGGDGAVEAGDAEETSAEAADDAGPRREGARLIFPVEPKENPNGVTFFHIRSDDVRRMLPSAHHFRITFYSAAPGASAADLTIGGLVNAMTTYNNWTDNLLDKSELAINPDEPNVSLWVIFDEDRRILAYGKNSGLSADRSEWTFETEVPEDFTAMMAKARELSRNVYEFPNTLFYPANSDYTEPDASGTLVVKQARTLLLDVSQLPESVREYAKVSWLTFLANPPGSPFPTIQSIEDVENIQTVLESNRLASLQGERMGYFYDMPVRGDGADTFQSMALPGVQPISFAFIFLIDEQGKMLAYSYYTGAERERWVIQPVEEPRAR